MCNISIMASAANTILLLLLCCRPSANSTSYYSVILSRVVKWCHETESQSLGEIRPKEHSHGISTLIKPFSSFELDVKKKISNLPIHTHDSTNNLGLDRVEVYRGSTIRSKSSLTVGRSCTDFIPEEASFFKTPGGTSSWEVCGSTLPLASFYSRTG
ncbi:hypothetical protein EDB82DRAFT_574977 [Fusarium venenatum]|uniref:uncharacterized protein n=1 Tax=Fusarium venenatum TaxID=56646 RepID=UPI001DE05152|nr:hypothetical protein EDB82DRAFT_574977 [Fusarium venenatum]